MSIVDRGAEHKTVGRLCLFDDFIDHIVVENTAIVQLVALVTGNAVPQRTCSQLNDLTICTFLFS